MRPSGALPRSRAGRLAAPSRKPPARTAPEPSNAPKQGATVVPALLCARTFPNLITPRYASRPTEARVRRLEAPKGPEFLPVYLPHDLPTSCPTKSWPTVCNRLYQESHSQDAQRERRTSGKDRQMSPKAEQQEMRTAAPAKPGAALGALLTGHLSSQSRAQSREKKVPKLYETDSSKYAGPHHWQIQWWARAVRRLWRYRTYTRWLEQACSEIVVTGDEHLEAFDGPCIFVANHQSHLDTLVVHAALPEAIRSRLYFGAAQDRWFVKGKKKLALKPWYQSLALGNFPIMRGGGVKALAYARWLLGKRQNIFLFPEGTRATTRELGEFKHGAMILAIEHNVPIVPIYLSGLQAIRPKGTQEVKKGVAGVHFLKPITFSPGSDVAAATALVYERMNAMHRRLTGTSYPEAA